MAAYIVSNYTVANPEVYEAYVKHRKLELEWEIAHFTHSNF